MIIFVLKMNFFKNNTQVLILLTYRVLKTLLPGKKTTSLSDLQFVRLLVCLFIDLCKFCNGFLSRPLN